MTDQTPPQDPQGGFPPQNPEGQQPPQWDQPQGDQQFQNAPPQGQQAYPQQGYPTQSYPQQGYPQQGQPYYQQPKKGMPTWAIVLLTIFGVLVLLVGGCVALFATAANEISEDLEEIVEESESLGDDAVAAAEVTGCTQSEIGGLWEAEVEFTSPFAEEKGFISIEVQFIDENDIVVDNGTALFENLSPGQSARDTASGFSVPDGTVITACVIADATVF